MVTQNKRHFDTQSTGRLFVFCFIYLFVLSSLGTSLPYILPGVAAGLFLVSGHWTKQSDKLRLT